MIPLHRIATLLFAALALVGPARADTRIFAFPLSAGQEVPPSGTGGSGQATVFLDDVTGAVSVTGTYTGLSSVAIAAHIHGPAPAGVNAGVIVGLTISGGTSGTLSGGGTLSAANVSDMIAGLTYVNLHTSSFGGGEIRGQIVAASAVPALPPTWVAGLAALALIGGAYLLSRRA